VASFQTKTGGTTKEDVFGSARLPQGVVHIFRERDADQNPQALEGTSASVSPQVSDNEGDGVTLAVLAVPSYMTPADFLTFVAPAEEGMSHLRMIRLVGQDSHAT
jgi:BRCA1-associated protein